LPKTKSAALKQIATAENYKTSAGLVLPHKKIKKNFTDITYSEDTGECKSLKTE
jgi:hypothetical protein